MPRGLRRTSSGRREFMGRAGGTCDLLACVWWRSAVSAVRGEAACPCQVRQWKWASVAARSLVDGGSRAFLTPERVCLREGCAWAAARGSAQL